MSIWYDIKDKEDINLSDDGKSLQINFNNDHNGNIWVEVPLELIDQLRQPPVSGRSEQLVCDVCGSTDVIEAPHIGGNCNRCHPL